MRKELFITISAAILLLGFTLWPRPKISADESRVWAHCPKGFINNVTWNTYRGYTPTEQLAEYVNDASAARCTIDWHWVRTGKSSY